MSNKDIDIYATYTQDEESDLQPDMTLAGKYRLIKQIGAGAMGVVWQAHERVADRLVALKFVPKECNRFKDELERMKKSFSKIHNLNHQSICPIYSLEDDGEFGYFLVMKFLEGETLDDHRHRKDPKNNGLPLDQVLELLKPVASALDYAHHHDVIHRDVKPSNIFLSETGKGINVEIIDFGLADEIREGMSRVSKVTFDTSGTPAYMAPEQWKGHRQTAATDQYALAVIAYELLAGNLPFSGSNMENAVLKYEPEPIREMPDSANAALLKALAKKGDERFDSCQDFLAALGGEDVNRARSVSKDK
jgi:serine/threonine-protein kinase